ncbi:MAG: hypothetical protein ACFCUI_00500 [Bernardetiaceae bacterium]
MTSSNLFFSRFLWGLVVSWGIFGGEVAAQGQPDLWRELSKVTYEKRYNPEIEENINYPVFGDNIKALDGKMVTVSGYVIPLEIGSDYFVLSAFPFASCFFCGAAGPETVMEVYSAKPFRVTSDARITVRGRLSLNQEDINHLMFMLHDAVLIP